MTESKDLAAALEGIVSAVPGVQQLYPVRPAAAIGAVTAAVAHLVGVDVEVPSRVAISDDQVQIMIGVTDDAPASHVAHAVHDAVVAHLTEAGIPVLQVAVKIARIG
jgi:hypothetical protein